jgi:hypothetical protein
VKSETLANFFCFAYTERPLYWRRAKTPAVWRCLDRTEADEIVMEFFLNNADDPPLEETTEPSLRGVLGEPKPSG